ncbi:MAG: DUF4339 domain-containing protein [Gemmataceae bacterium]|nr:DUF4339 domain-containing protein [Gemmataceae bacterium]
MAKLWFYTREGQQTGPVSEAELKQLAANGVLKPTDMVWTEGMPAWVRASTSASLFPQDGIIVSPSEGPRKAAPIRSELPPKERATKRLLDRDEDDQDRRQRRGRPERDNDEHRPRRRRRSEQRGLSSGAKKGIVAGAVGLLLIVAVVVIIAVTRSGGGGGPGGGGAAGGGGPDFMAAADNFKVKFPSNPKQQTQNILGSATSMYTLETRDGAMIVSVTDMSHLIPAGEPDAKIQNRLDGSQQGAVGNIGANMTSSQRIMLGGRHPGRDFWADLPGNKGKLHARVYLVDRKLYQLLVMGVPSYVNSGAANSFLESFALLK